VGCHGAGVCGHGRQGVGLACLRDLKSLELHSGREGACPRGSCDLRHHYSPSPAIESEPEIHSGLTQNLGQL
jgi:hypothetical protein